MHVWGDFGNRGHGAFYRHERKNRYRGHADAAEPLLRECLAKQSKFTEAEPLLLAGYEGLKLREAAIPPEAATRIPEAIERLARLYEAIGDQPKASEWKSRLETAKPPVADKPKVP